MPSLRRGAPVTAAGWLLPILCMVSLTASVAAQARLDVSVKDSAGGTIPGATVAVLSAQRTPVAGAVVDGEGRWSTDRLAPGQYLVRASAPGFGERYEAVRVGHEGHIDLALVLAPAAISEEVTVTASPGLVQGVDSAAQQVNVIDQDELRQRAKAVFGQVVNEEVGVHWQRTSPTISGVFVRGLTGNKVNVFVDGVRYSTAAQRGGINSFMNLNDANNLEGVEILRGPSSAQYGSDALGGSIQLLTRTPAFAGAAARRWQGAFTTALSSADSGYGGSLYTQYAGPRLSGLVSLTGRRANRLRTGKGLDSHNAVTRFFDLDSRDFFGARRDDTESSQYGGSVKLAWEAGANTRLLASYTRGQQDGGQRYDQLIGGDGNLVADLRNFMLDFGYVRLERQRIGPLDSAFVSASYNAQREERVNQGGNGNPRATINHEYEKTRVLGLQAGIAKGWARHSLSVGADFYAERINAPSFGFNPVTGLSAVRRGRVPDEARYDSGGVYAQDTWRPSERLTLQGNLRLGFASYESRADASPLVAGRRLWPDDSFDNTNLTYRAGAVFALRPHLALTASVSRGHRAPHVTDLGTLGLTGDGFEVAAVELAGRGATIGSTADARAASTGVPVAQPTPELSRTFEAGLRWHAPRVELDLVGFLTDIDDNITKQALVLPQGAVGSTLGDQTIVRQDPNGVVYVPLASNPVLVQANYDEARLWGLEQRLRLHLNASWSASTVMTYLRAEDRRTGLAPNIEGGTPAPDGWFTVRFTPGGGRRGWIEGYVHAALEQDNLSSLDLGDRRTGAGRTRSSIANFFNNGARARGLIGPGADGQAGTADDVLRATGETLAQVQTRVLGSASSSSLFTAVPGYTVFGLRGLWRLSSRHEVFVDLENLGDRNYRGISWGLDAPGRSVFVQYRARF